MFLTHWATTGTPINLILEMAWALNLEITNLYIKKKKKKKKKPTKPQKKKKKKKIGKKIEKKRKSRHENLAKYLRQKEAKGAK